MTNCYKMKKEKKIKKREKLRDKREQESIAITWLTEKGAKTLQSVRSWINQWNCSGVNVQAQGLGKTFQLWAMKCGTCLIFPEKLF